MHAIALGATPAEIEDYFEHCRSEAELASCLFLIAAAEARLRDDAQWRSSRRASDLEGRLGLLYEKADVTWQVALDQSGIIEAWKNFLHATKDLAELDRSRWAGRIGKFRSILQLRHWVAHGRNWPLKANLCAWSITEVAKIVEDLFQALNDIAGHAKLPSVA